MSRGVQRQSHWLRMDDGTHIHVRTWEDETAPPRAMLQLAHGMAEHIERYDAFAEFMAGQGISVVGNDHRGHGRTGERADCLVILLIRTGLIGWWTIVGPLPNGSRPAIRICPSS